MQSTRGAQNSPSLLSPTSILDEFVAQSSNFSVIPQLGLEVVTATHLRRAAASGCPPGAISIIAKEVANFYGIFCATGMIKKDQKGQAYLSIPPSTKSLQSLLGKQVAYRRKI